MRDKVIFYLNGERREIGLPQAGLMLADFLRYEVGLTGTKIVCAEGDCGACTVLRYFPQATFRTNLKKNFKANFKTDSKTNLKKPQFVPVNSCITTVAQMDGSSLVTVDALAVHKFDAARSDLTQLSPVQESMVKCHGSQCGFCTPGFVMALQGLVEKKLKKKGDANCRISAADAKNALTGNLCRCTGYQPIIDSAVSLDLKQCQSVADRFFSTIQDKDLRAIIEKPLHLKSDSFEFYAPTSLKAATQYLGRHKDARLLAAATDLGVFHNKRKLRLQKTLSFHLLPELYEIKTVAKKWVSVGARVTLSELRRFIRTLSPEFARLLDLFASPQIKNVATLIGNVANASPIADTPPFLLASDATIELVGPRGRRSISIDDFFIAYRKTAVKHGEFISAIRFLLPTKNEKLQLRKVSARKDLDIAAVNSAFRMTWAKNDSAVIEDLRLAIGGVAAIPLRLKKTEKCLIGQTLTVEAIEKAMPILQAEITPLSDVRGSSAYRRVLVENLLRRFLNEAMP